MITGAFPLFYSFVWSEWENIIDRFQSRDHFTIGRYVVRFVRYRRGDDHTYLSLLGVFATTTDSTFAYKHKNLVYLKERELVNK